MSNRQLGGPPQRRDEDIQDAEFTEVENWKAAPSPPPPAAPPPMRRRGCLTYGFIGLAVVLLLLIATCVAFPAPESAPADENVEEVTDGSTASDPIGEDLPSLSQLVQSNDARACGHPDAVATIRSSVLPTDGNEDAETLRLLKLAQFDFTEVSASSIRQDVHEITCEANLRYGGGARDLEPITFKLRVAADPASPPLVYFVPTDAQALWLADRILSRPREIVAAERARQAPPPLQIEPASPVSPPEDNDAAAAPSDEAQFAPQ